MLDRSLRRRLPPRIATPEFWPATFDRFDEILSASDHCQVEHIGTSAGGRAIHAVNYRGQPDAPTLGLVGGIHGHESQGAAACFNVISVLGFGRDLKGTSWPGIVDDLNYAIVPVANPDARARMPNAFVGLARQDILYYDAGMTVEGDRYDPAEGDCNPAEMMILGGLFNDAGQHVSREQDPGNIRSPEIRALMEFMGERSPDIVLEFHAHAAPPLMIRPTNLVPPEVQEHQMALCHEIIDAAKAEEILFDGKIITSERSTAALYHHFSGATPLIYESPQGVLDSKAPWSHEQIIDTCMFVVSHLCSELMG